MEDRSEWNRFWLSGKVADYLKYAAKAEKGRPSAILLKTTKGKGVSFMENNMGWHGKAPNDAEYEQGMAELTAALKELEGETV